MTENYIDWATQLDLDFRTAAGIDDRRFYKIFYSHLHASSFFVLGLNPGGIPNSSEKLLSASPTFYEKWEHDYVRFRHDSRYALAAPMYATLSRLLETTDPDVLRQIPATNIVFRRSQNMDALSSWSILVRESQSVLKRILDVVQPHLILAISKSAYDLFKQHYCAQLRNQSIQPVFTPNGRYPAMIYASAEVLLANSSRWTKLVCLGHPSKYAGRVEWADAVSRAQQDVQEAGITTQSVSLYMNCLVPLRDQK